jgi:hypothetical protein
MGMTLLDTQAAGRGEPCVFYYLSDSPDGRPRMCGNPNFRMCYHQLQCAECEAYIETELAEVIEQRPGVLHIAVPIPLPDQLIADLTKQEERIPIDEPPRPPPIPSAAFHFNKRWPLALKQEALRTQAGWISCGRRWQTCRRNWQRKGNKTRAMFRSDC